MIARRRWADFGLIVMAGSLLFTHEWQLSARRNLFGI